MKISFIIPAYNVEKYIVECVDSVLNQEMSNYPEIEIEAIVINDGSNDETKIRLEEYNDDPRVMIINKKNEGVSKTRNIGIELAQGDYLFFLDGDDVLDTHLIQKVYLYLRKKTDICFIEHFEWKKDNRLPENNENKTGFYIGKTDFEEFEKATFNRDIKGKYDYHKLKMATPCKFYRAALIKENKIYFPIEVKTGEDAIFNMAVYQVANSAYYIPQPLYFHRIIATSVSHQYNPNTTNNFDILHTYLKKYVSVKPELEKYYDERCLWSVGFCCLLDFLAKDNPKSYYERREDFSDYRKKYLQEIKKGSLKDFRLKKRLMMFLIRYNQFHILDKLAKLGLVK